MFNVSAHVKSRALSVPTNRPGRQDRRHDLRRAVRVTCLALVLFLATSTVALADTVIQHRVQSGESVTSIARKYGVTTGQILRENNIVNADLLRVGQTLSITVPDSASAPAPAPAATPVPTPIPADESSSAPAATEQAPPPAAPTTAPTSAPTATRRPASVGCNQTSQTGDLRYTIRSGDSLYGLAARYGVTVTAIKQRNCLTSDVVVGQLVIIPMGANNPNGGAGPTAIPRSTSSNQPTVTPTPRPTPTATPAPTPTPARSWLDRLLNG